MNSLIEDFDNINQRLKQLEAEKAPPAELPQVYPDYAPCEYLSTASEPA